MDKNIDFQDGSSVKKIFKKMGLIPAYFGYEAYRLTPGNKREKRFVEAWIMVNNNLPPEKKEDSPCSSNFIVCNKLIKDLNPLSKQEHDYRIALNTMVQYLGCLAGYAFMSMEWKETGYPIKDLYKMPLSPANLRYVKKYRELRKKNQGYQKILQKETQNILGGYTTPTSHWLLDSLLDWLMTTEEGFSFHIEAYKKVF